MSQQIFNDEASLCDHLVKRYVPKFIWAISIILFAKGHSFQVVTVHDFLLGFGINFKVDFNVDVEVVKLGQPASGR